MPNIADIKAQILTQLPGAQVELEDMNGKGDHFSAKVQAPQFAGKSRVEQHQMVYAALGNAMRGEIHALALETQPL